jgi:hypothetical protein
VEWRLYEWAHNMLTICLPFTVRSETVRESGYISEKVFSVASAVICVSGELKSGNVLTNGQRVCGQQMGCEFGSEASVVEVGCVIDKGRSSERSRHRGEPPTVISRFSDNNFGWHLHSYMPRGS